MDCDVPLIVGMPFCNDLHPFVEWSNRRVFIRDSDHYVELQTTSIDKHTSNSKAKLNVHVGNVDNVLCTPESKN